jgi:hypothetical protein
MGGGAQPIRSARGVTRRLEFDRCCFRVGFGKADVGPTGL